jgi:hypothetical protein
METVVDRISWRRRGARNDFFGSLRAGDEGIRLIGRDVRSGIDLALSIPPGQVANVHVSASGDDARDPIVVLELDDAEPIFVRHVGPGPLDAQLLARKLGMLVRRYRLLAQGG